MYHYSVINLFNVNYIIKREEYTEIEKKFLVSGDYKIHVKSSNKIIQGYISHEPSRSVRTRIKDDSGFITIKGETTNGGIKRFEWEKPIERPEWL